MFTRRDRAATAEAAAPSPAVDAQGKGRATPKRREAELERKQRIRPPRDSRQRSAQERQRKQSERQKYRAGLDRGEERYLPARDKGPVRKFVRDFVDGRLSAAEFFMPIAFAALIFMLFGQSAMGGTLSSLMILFVLVDMAFTSFLVRRALRGRFPEESTRGAASYAIMRSLVWRSMRTPKPQVARGYRPQ